MSAGGPAAVTSVEPFFLQAKAGRIFGVHHQPPDVTKLRGHVLVVPPFNEEMNRCRSMVTLQARALARAGFGTLLVDLHGTGDSEGEYSDARWEIWLDDLHTAFRWLDAKSGGCVALLGIRLGALLAAQLHERLGRESLPVVLWQPVVDGKLHLTQFLRVRMAAQLDRPNLPKETTATMRQQLQAGQPVEVAGYELSPELTNAIDAASLGQHVPSKAPVLWLEHAATDSTEIALPVKNVVQDWTNKGAMVDLRSYNGPAFWHLHERVLTPSVVDISTQWLETKVSA